MKRAIKGQLSKIKFEVGLNPVVEKKDDANDFIPEDYQSVITITADFELAWAPRYTNSVKDPYPFALGLARRERENVPKIIDLCEEFEIPITWATVGHLFLDSCSKTNGRKHPDIPPVPGYIGTYWNFTGDDWFEYDPCTSLGNDPEWYAPDLVKLILASKTGHEIGCHTFSHIDCRDDVCPPELMASELVACMHQAEKFGLTLSSFVHPGHTIGNLKTLADLGFSSFQTDPGNLLGFPVKHSSGLWELKRTMEFIYRPEWSISYHIYRYKKIIDRAIKYGRVCNFWFHPSFPTILIEKILPGIFSYIQENKKKIWICPVNDYVNYLKTI